MKVEFEIHSIQAEILRTLLFHTEQKFSQLNTKKAPSDQFNFHIQRLQDLELIEKNENGLYTLTTRGKEFANKFDTDTNKIERQAKVAVLVCAVKEENGQKMYLIQQRLKQPYFGYHGFLTGKIKWGEKMKEAAERELMEETGLTGELTFVGLHHKMDYDLSKNLLEDKYFHVFRAENAKGKLIEQFEGGKNFWLTEEELYKLDKQFDGIPVTLEMANTKSFLVVEKGYVVKEY